MTRSFCWSDEREGRLQVVGKKRGKPLVVGKNGGKLQAAGNTVEGGF